MIRNMEDILVCPESPWFANWIWGENWILCDQLAMVAALYRESVVASSRHWAAVELAGSRTRGMMVLDQRAVMEKQRNVTIIEKLDTDILKNSLLRAFSM